MEDKRRENPKAVLSVEEKVNEFGAIFQRLEKEIQKVIVGHQKVIEGILICLLSPGHVLLEGVPGLGKTLLVKTLSGVLNLSFSRIQFTPDLMPADIIGTNIMGESERGEKFFRFQPGPIFAHIILADEINRATPKTQSALLEAMQEVGVTVAGILHRLEDPFFVLATQNPIEMEGTYPLPEAQLDRFFFKLKIEYPNLSELDEIVERTTKSEIPYVEKVTSGNEILEMRRIVREVPIASYVKDYALKLVMATHPDSSNAPSQVRRFVKYGSSPRGAQSLVLGGKVKALIDKRYNVSFDDIREVAHPSLRHRIILNFEGEAEGLDANDLIDIILKEVKSEK